MNDFKRLVAELERRGCPADAIQSLRDGASSALEWVKAADAEQAQRQAEFEAARFDPATSVVIARGRLSSDDRRGVITRATKASVWVTIGRHVEPSRYSLKDGRCVGDSSYLARRIRRGTSTHPAIVGAGL